MKTDNVRLISKTEVVDGFDIDGLDFSNPEQLMMYIARVSSSNQENPNYAKLLRRCLDHGHWSVFEHITLTFEIKTSRAIAAQILRHRSFCFQEFSQRYAKVSSDAVETIHARRQAKKNRQSSVDDLPAEDIEFFQDAQQVLWDKAQKLYQESIDRGIAKECARFLLPLNTSTRLFMTGNLRSWIHYLSLRTAEGTQKEHRDIALAIQAILKDSFPVVAEALEW